MGMARLKPQGILSQEVLTSPAPPLASDLELNNVVEPNKDKKFQQVFLILVLEISFLKKKSNFKYSKQMLRWPTDKP